MDLAEEADGGGGGGGVDEETFTVAELPLNVDKRVIAGNTRSVEVGLEEKPACDVFDFDICGLELPYSRYILLLEVDDKDEEEGVVATRLLGEKILITDAGSRSGEAGAVPTNEASFSPLSFSILQGAFSKVDDAACSSSSAELGLRPSR